MLPKQFSIKDVVSCRGSTPIHLILKATQVFNFQRIPLLTIALGESPPNPADIYQAMQDRVGPAMLAFILNPKLTDDRYTSHIARSLSPVSHIFYAQLRQSRIQDCLEYACQVLGLA